MKGRARPIGSEVGLYVDLVDRVYFGDLIETRSGRKYGVVSVRIQARGKRAGRQHLRAIVLDADAQPGTRHDDRGVDIGAGRVHRIRWYARRSKGGGGVKGAKRRD